MNDETVYLDVRKKPRKKPTGEPLSLAEQTSERALQLYQRAQFLEKCGYRKAAESMLEKAEVFCKKLIDLDRKALQRSSLHGFRTGPYKMLGLIALWRGKKEEAITWLREIWLLDEGAEQILRDRLGVDIPKNPFLLLREWEAEAPIRKEREMKLRLELVIERLRQKHINPPRPPHWWQKAWLRLKRTFVPPVSTRLYFQDPEPPVGPWGIVKRKTSRLWDRVFHGIEYVDPCRKRR